MAHSEPAAGQRTGVAHPAEPAARGPRNGYVLLAVSGVVLATAFGGIAQLVTPSKATSGVSGGNNSPGSQQIAPSSTVPGSDSATKDSSSTAASPSSSSSASPSAVNVRPEKQGPGEPEEQSTVTLAPSSNPARDAVPPPPSDLPPPHTTTGGSEGRPTTSTTASPPTTPTAPPSATPTTSPTPTSQEGAPSTR